MLEYLESQVFSRIKYKFPADVKNKFPKLDFTTDSNRATKDTSFPLVYVHSLGGVENSKDLERTRLNGMTATFQVDVTDNENQANARTVINEVVKIMKSMLFEVSTMPMPSDYGGVYRYVARFRRNIDENDIL